MASALGLVSRIENILAADDQDQVKESFGATEQQIAKIVLILAALPSVIFPIAYHIFRKSFYWVASFVIAYLIALFFVIQYRLDVIVSLSEQFHSLLNYA
ncbi:hypothetical protein TNCT_549621 [Trichonephila clavata]|uniref:Uncharacterized protein n=1 Tax=Trichonephila clavata TaxID=2740835 RepID=A0A8X6M6A3_TRICU|nr:hypothetical protein TNCT_420511 [Trichonephila clavata]GFR33708.1 hypothetical protein TNCT_549621 [Trichonephila clavata]